MPPSPKIPNGKQFEAYAPSTTQSRPPQQQRQGRLIAIVVIAVVFFIVIFSTPAVNEVEQVAKSASKHLPHGPKIPLYNPFRQAVHEPPEQSNSSHGDSKWYSDWKWLHPFSSTITLDDTRSVLPPLQARPPIYTYYDASTEKDPAVQKEIKNLLQIWRRAWWAQGFRPVILGRAEAMKNPHYELVQKKELYEVLENEMMRWLAWAHMGDGVLSNWLALPMASRQDHDLSFLRRGAYPSLIRYENIGVGLFAGPASQIEAAIKAVLDNPKLEDRKNIWEALEDPHLFEVEPVPKGIAFYDSAVLSKSYGLVADQISDSKSEGLVSLGKLITCHLHGTFLASFPDGFNVLTVSPKETTIISGPALAVAQALNLCPESPLPRSCPPNKAQCTPCGPIKLNFRPSLINGTKEFTLGSIPHPYTNALMLQAKAPESLTVRYVRRESPRDPWLDKATEQVLKLGISGYERIVHFKESTVTDAGQASGLWHTAERDLVWNELEWRFGFTLPDKNGTIPLPRPNDASYPIELEAMLKAMGKRPLRKDLVQQAKLLDAAKDELKKTEHKHTWTGAEPDMRRVVEAWNLADAEAWRFVRAFEARARMERETWEKDESRFLDESMRVKE